MDNRQNESQKRMTLPEGYFCGGNCSDCVYWERSNRDSTDRAYCNNFGSYYYPSERQGCLRYERR